MGRLLLMAVFCMCVCCFDIVLGCPNKLFAALLPPVLSCEFDVLSDEC